jgi:hypothetical protein
MTSILLFSQYIPVSIGIVLLMQSVWMGVTRNVLRKKLPSAQKW